MLDWAVICIYPLIQHSITPSRASRLDAPPSWCRGGEGGNGLPKWSQSRPYNYIFISRKPRPYMLYCTNILVVEKGERELPRPCHTMTSHRLTPLPPYSLLNWMINRMLLILTTHIRPSTGSDHSSTPVWNNLRAQRLCKEVKS